MALSRRSWAAIAVICCWGAALGWLGLRRLGVSDSARITAQAALRLAPGDAWFRVMAGSTQLGYGGITLDTLADGSYRIREQLNIELPGKTGIYRAIRSSEYYLTPSLTVDSLTSRYTTTRRAERIRGIARDGGWQVTLTRGGTAEASGRLHLEQPSGAALAPIPLTAVSLRLALVGAIASGEGRTVTVADGWPPAALPSPATVGTDTTVIFADSSEVDPVTSRWVPITFDTVRARVLLLASPAGPRRLLVDRGGAVVRIEEPFGVRWEREEFSMARFNFRQSMDSSGAALRAALPVVRPLLGSAWAADTSTDARRWRVTHRDGSPIDPASLALLSENRQEVGDAGILEVRSRARRGLSIAEESDPLIQVDDSAVVALAGALDSMLQQRQFKRFATELRRRITVDTAIALPIDAAGAARIGRATPDGLARLTVALFRHAGIRARLAIGVMPRGDTLYSHSWVEYRDDNNLDETVDPLTGHRASTGLVRLGMAGSSHPEDLLLHVADVRFTPADQPVAEGDGQ